MPAKMTFKTQEEAPEEFREHLQKVDGGFEISVVPKPVHDQFRENNVNLLKERDALNTQVAGYKAIVGDDADKFKGELGELRTTAQKVKDGTLKTNEAIEAEVAKRVSTREGGFNTEKQQLQEQLTAAQGAGRAWEDKFKAERLGSEIAAMVSAKDSGFNPSAIPDIQARARGIWHVQEDGSLLPKKGDAVIYSKKAAGQPMTLKEWGASLLEEAPHFGKSSAGGGATGGGAGGENIAGMSATDFDKLTPAERITRYREAQAGGR